jgi:hypothetical protein
VRPHAVMERLLRTGHVEAGSCPPLHSNNSSIRGVGLAGPWSAALEDFGFPWAISE